MTVKEYLEIINNCVIYNKMNTEDIKYLGFLKVLPSIEKSIIHISKPVLTINNDKIIVQRTYTNKDEVISHSNEILLSDSISKYAEDGMTEIEIIEKTIEALKEIEATQNLTEGNIIKKLENYISEHYTMSNSQKK